MSGYVVVVVVGAVGAIAGLALGHLAIVRDPDIDGWSALGLAFWVASSTLAAFAWATRKWSDLTIGGVRWAGFAAALLLLGAWWLGVLIVTRGARSAEDTPDEA